MNRFFTLLLAASCLTAVGQSEYCLDGTVWDEALQGCVPESGACEVFSDLDENGSVGSGDLLSLLSAFGNTFPDVDADGVCDELDECVGMYDECGVCNGPGAIYDCGCEECTPFSCGNPVGYFGFDYQTVQIGDQCWFAENLRSDYYRNGDLIPSNLNDSAWYYSSSGALNVSEVSCFSEPEWYYNKLAALDERHLCPSGWRVPSVNDFDALVAYSDSVFGNLEYTTSALVSAANAPWCPGLDGSNESGFGALSVGVYERTPWCTEQSDLGCLETGIGLPPCFSWGGGTYPFIWIGCNFWTSDDSLNTADDYCVLEPSDLGCSLGSPCCLEQELINELYCPTRGQAYRLGSQWDETGSNVWGSAGDLQVAVMNGLSVRCIKD